MFQPAYAERAEATKRVLELRNETRTRHEMTSPIRDPTIMAVKLNSERFKQKLTPAWTSNSAVAATQTKPECHRLPLSLL